MRSPFADVFAALREAFEAAGVSWYVFGAQAAILHGSARLSADVDVTVDLRGESRPTPLVGPLAAAGFTRRELDDAAVEATRVLPVTHRVTSIPVDIVLAGPGLEALFLERARPMDVGGVRVPVACAEDVVAMKLLAGRPKDFEDVEAIVAAHGARLDLDLVRATIALLEGALDRNDLSRALDRALVVAGGGASPKPAPKRRRTRRTR